MAAGRMATNFQSTVPPWLTVTTTWPGTYALPVVSCWVYGMPQIGVVRHRCVGRVVRESNDRAPDEVHADDLVPSALLGGQKADRDRPLGPCGIAFGLDEGRHRRVRTNPLVAKLRAEVGILREHPHGLVELVSRRRGLLAGLDDLRAAATVDRGVDDERLVLLVVEDRRPVDDRLRRSEATGSLSLLLLDGLDREQPMPSATEALAGPTRG